MASLAAYLLVLLAPLTVVFPLGPPVVRGVFTFYVQMAVELSDAAALALLLTAGVRARLQRGAPSTAAAVFTSAPFALSALALVTSAFALHPPLAVYSALRWLLAAGVGSALLYVPISARGIAIALSVGLVPHIVIGIGQSLTHGPLGLPGELVPPFSNPGVAILGTSAEPWLRAYGLTFHPNVLGGFVCVAIILLLPLLDRLVLRLVWLLLWVGLLLTFSRSAWLATAVVLPIAGTWLVRHRPPLRRPLAGACASLAIFALFGGTLFAPQLASRLAPMNSTGIASPPRNAEQSSLSARANMARAALVAIREHPIVGIGAGEFPLEMLRQRTHTPPQYVHNVPLLLAAEVGLLGGLVWIAAWLGGIVSLFSRWRQLTPEALTALCAWCAVGIIGLFDCYPWSLHAGRLLTVVTLVLVDRARTTESDQ